MPPQLHHAGLLVSLNTALEASQSSKAGMIIEGLERGLSLHNEDLTALKLNVSSFQRALNAEKPRQTRLKKDSWVKIYPHKTTKSLFIYLNEKEIRMIAGEVAEKLLSRKTEERKRVEKPGAAGTAGTSTAAADGNGSGNGLKEQAVEMLKNGLGTKEVAEALGLRRQQVAAYKAWITMRGY